MGDDFVAFDNGTGLTKLLVHAVAGCECQARIAVIKAMLGERVFIDNLAGTGWVRPHAAQWLQIEPGSVRLMLCQGALSSWLVRLEPGARLSMETLQHADESLVLSGSCYVDGRLLQEGDLSMASQPQKHYEIVSQTGCVLYMSGSPPATRFPV